MALIHCPHCGQFISDKASTCPKCGYNLTQPQHSGNGNGGNAIIIVLIVAIVLVVLGVGIYLMSTHVVGNKMNAEASDSDSVAVDAAASDTTMLDSSYIVGQQYDNAATDASSDNSSNTDYSSGTSNADYDWLSYRKADYSDISDVPSSELRIMRNWIYARHGYIFRSDDLRRYFSQFDWYTPQYHDVSSQLNDIERYNVLFLKNNE